MGKNSSFWIQRFPKLIKPNPKFIKGTYLLDEYDFRLDEPVMHSGYFVVKQTQQAGKRAFLKRIHMYNGHSHDYTVYAPDPRKFKRVSKRAIIAMLI